MAQSESTVDPTYPVDNEQVDKARMRANFQATFDDITYLLRITRYPYQVMLGTATMLT